MWPDAVIQGMMAASAICGKKVVYPGIFKFLTTKIEDTKEFLEEPSQPVVMGMEAVMKEI